MEYKSGDRVIFRTEWPPEGRWWNSVGEMDEWLGCTVTIDWIHGSSFEIIEDHGRWGWRTSVIEGLEETDDWNPVSEEIVTDFLFSTGG